MTGCALQLDAAPQGNQAAGVVRTREAEVLLQGPVGAEKLAGSEHTGGRAAILVHRLAPRALGSPIHTHRDEDEYSFVLEGEVGVQVGGETVVARPGDLVCKPRGVPHAFWNATDRPARLLEVIVPGGLEDYFVRIAGLFAAPGPPDLDALEEVAASFGVQVDPASVPQLAQAHGLVLS